MWQKNFADHDTTAELGQENQNRSEITNFADEICQVLQLELQGRQVFVDRQLALNALLRCRSVQRSRFGLGRRIAHRQTVGSGMAP